MFMVRRSVDITFLPLLSSSTRVSTRDGVDEEKGGGSGPNGFWGVDSGEEEEKVVSGDEAVSGNQVGFTKRSS